jgi:hypothetical protein
MINATSDCSLEGSPSAAAELVVWALLIATDVSARMTVEERDRKEK